MTKDEVLKLAKEHGLLPDGELPKTPIERFVDYQDLRDELLAFANAIADAQREKDARICEAFGGFKDGYSCASAIRSKGD